MPNIYSQKIRNAYFNQTQHQMWEECRGSEDTYLLFCVTVAADEEKPLGYSSNLTIPEIVIECYDTPDTTLFDPFKYDLWMVHDQTDPDSFISSDEALDESDGEDSRSELLDEADLDQQLLTDNGRSSNDSSPELDADTLPYLTYFLDQAKIGPKAQVNTTVWCNDQSMSSTSHNAAKTDQKAADVMKDDSGENRGLCRLVDDAGRSQQCSRPCLYMFSGPHIKREPCSVEQSPLGEWCRPPCRLYVEDFF
jgi:hypothetical protein